MLFWNMREETLVVTAALHAQIETARHDLVLAAGAGLPCETYSHRAHREDLMDRAAREGTDVTAGVDRSQLPPLTLAAS